MIGTALVDAAFCRALLENPAEAVARFQLAADEVSALACIHAQTLEQFADEVVAWLGARARAVSA